MMPLMHHPEASLLLLSLLSCAPEVADPPTPPRSVPAGDTAAPVAPSPTTTPTAPAQCEVDADCVPATCCSASACVPYDQKPTCTGVACNDACVAGVDDVYCNGRCTCTQGQCGVHFSPNPRVTLPRTGN